MSAVDAYKFDIGSKVIAIKEGTSFLELGSVCNIRKRPRGRTLYTVTHIDGTDRIYYSSELELASAYLDILEYKVRKLKDQFAKYKTYRIIR